MAISNEERKVAENWLTRGKHVAVRTRGTIRPRAASVADIEIIHITEVSEFLHRLKKELPDVPWIIVIDGKLDSFAGEVCYQAMENKEDCRFWLVDSGEIRSEKDPSLASMDFLRLDSLKDDDSRFIENLVADLVIIPLKPENSQRTRIERWLYRSRYILIKEAGVPVIKEIQSSGFVSSRSCAGIISSP